MLSYRVIIALFAMALFVQSATAIDCHRCDACEDGDDGGDAKACPEGVTNCYKLYYEDKDDEQRAYRGCLPLTAHDIVADDDCADKNTDEMQGIFNKIFGDNQKSVPSDTKSWGVCRCNEDECNSAPIYGVSTLLIVGAALIRHLF